MHTTSDGRLILNRQEASPGLSDFGRQPLAQGATAIYEKRDRTLVPLGRSLFPMENKFCRFKVRYDVSVAEHEYNDVDVSSWLVSSNDALRFTGTISFGFRVVDAEEVVRRNIVDGYSRVLSRLRDRLLVISRQFQITQYAQLQNEMNLAFGTELMLDGGILVYRFSAHIVRNAAALQADEAAAAALARIAVVDAEGRLATAQQTTNNALEIQKMEALQHALTGNFDPLHLVLARNPDRVLEILEMVANSRQASARQQQEILNNLIDNNLINQQDVAEIRERIIGGVMQTAGHGPIGLHDMLTRRQDPAPELTQSPQQAVQQGAQEAVTVAAEPAEAPSIPRQASGVTGMKRRRTGASDEDQP